MRSTSPRVPDTACPPIAADVQAAFVVLARREVSDEAFRAGQLPIIDLRDTCLVGLQTPDSDLTGFALADADLTGANLYSLRADLIGLDDTVLVRANLDSSDLTSLAFIRRADLTAAQLRGARFGSVALVDVTLVGADLSGADLGEARLERVDLTGALHDRETVTARVIHDATSIGVWWD